MSMNVQLNLQLKITSAEPNRACLSIKLEEEMDSPKPTWRWAIMSSARKCVQNDQATIHHQPEWFMEKYIHQNIVKYLVNLVKNIRYLFQQNKSDMQILEKPGSKLQSATGGNTVIKQNPDKKSSPKFDTSHYHDTENTKSGEEYPELLEIGRLNLAKATDYGISDLDI